MKTKLTDRERIALGYDEPHERDDSDTVRAIVRKTTGKPIELTADELARLWSDAVILARSGTDTANARTTTRLLHKLGLGD